MKAYSYLHFIGKETDDLHISQGTSLRWEAVEYE